jgi:hypothetical protein
MKIRLSVLSVLFCLWMVGGLAVAPPLGVWRNLSPAAWLWQGVPVEATYNPTPLKSVQHVTCTNTQTISISTIDPNYAVINMIGHGAANGFVDLTNMAVRATFATAASITCTSSSSSSVIVFEVLDFLPQMLKHITVRDLAVSIAAGGNNNGTATTGYTVNLAKSVAFFQGCVNTNNQSTPAVSFTTALINTTQIRVYKNYGDYGFACAVGMAEFK